MRYPKRSAFALLFALLASIALWATDVPDMAGPVNDLAGVMSDSEKNELDSWLREVSTQTGVQVAVLTVKSLEGEAIEQYSMRVAEKWKLGDADKDNGALLVVSLEDKSLRIEVGYGLEESLTDVKSGLIIRNVIVPYFKDGNYGEGIIEGAKAIANVATGNAQIDEPSSQQPVEGVGSSDIDVPGLVGAVFFIIMFLFLRIGLSGRRMRRGGMGGLILPAVLFALLNSAGRSRGSGFGGSSGGGFGGFSGHSGSGGGFSGGGGSFGGGGASGSW